MKETSIKTDDSLMETKHHGSSGFPMAFYHENIYDYDFHTVDWHWHHEFQFEYAENGAIICMIGPDRFVLNEGCGLLINSGVIHRFEAESEAYENSIIFAPELLGEEDTLIYDRYLKRIMKNGPAYQLLDPQISWQKKALEELEFIHRNFHDSLQYEGADGNELLLMSHLFALMNIIVRNIPMSETDSENSPDLKQVRLRQMMQYIQDNYRSDLTLEQIAQSAAVSKSSAIAIFNTCIHTTPIRYLMEHRLRMASDLLRSTKKTAALIAEETGFYDAGYFSRKFREVYHMTPGEYRKGIKPKP